MDKKFEETFHMGKKNKVVDWLCKKLLSLINLEQVEKAN